jgi:uncharacterized LabA/DUF88 family protein
LPAEPVSKRAIVFFDGQNLFHGVRRLWGYSFPNYNVLALASLICARESWWLEQARFYTGIPSRQSDPRWHGFWSKKIGYMGKQGVHCFTRPLRYHSDEVVLPDGSRQQVQVGREKGIDVRIAIDVIRLAHKNAYDVAVIVSQDSDLSEAAAEIRHIAREQRRWIKVASVYLDAPGEPRRGIDLTDWLPLSRSEYDSCVDKNDYRLPSEPRQSP